MYWITKGLLALLLMASSIMFIINNEIIQQSYINVGYTVYLIYPLEVLKISTVIAIVLFVTSYATYNKISKVKLLTI